MGGSLTPWKRGIKQANDRGNVGDRQSERQRWTQMMCALMGLCGFNVTSGPGVCVHVHVGGDNNMQFTVRGRMDVQGCAYECVCVHVWGSYEL